MFKFFKSFLVVAMVLALAIGALGCNTKSSNDASSETTEEQTQEPASENQSNETTEQSGEEPKVSELQIDVNKEYVAVLKTSKGDVKVKFFPKEAPKTVDNFVTLSRKGFYNGTIFHRVIPDFMIQGGDPEGNGTGGPGYTFEDEINSIKMVKGKMAMANRGPNTNGSQFFIVTAQATPWLDGKHTVFGEIIEGQNIVDDISLVKTDDSDRPVEPVQLISVTIEEK